MLHPAARLFMLFPYLVSTGAVGLASAEESFRAFDIPAESAEKTLQQFAVQSGMEVLFSTKAASGIRTNAVKGQLAPAEAVKQMLSGTPLYIVNDSKNGVLRIARDNRSSSRQPPSLQAPSSANDERQKKKNP